MKITIIHPSRQRFEMASRTCAEWIEKASNPQDIDYHVSIDADEPHRELYENFPLWKVTVSSNTSAIDAINNCARILERETTSSILVIVSDDFGCPKNWDSYLGMHLKDKSDFIVKTSDGIQDWLITLPMMDWNYYRRFGYVYHPSYRHMFADTEMSCVADMLGKKIDLRNTGYIFEHRHYTAGKMAKDAINQKNDSTWEQGEKLFYHRMSMDFNLPSGQIVSRDCLAQFTKK